MKNKEEKSRKTIKKSNNFFKANWVSLVLIILAILVIAVLCSIVITKSANKKSLENDINKNSINNSFSPQKIVCYSSAYGTTNSETNARWNLNLSQYTDIAIYLDNKSNVSSMYIDDISFSNNDIGNLSLNYLPIESFGKIDNGVKSEQANVESVEGENVTNTTKSTLLETPQRIDLSLSTPITLRYLNSNLKENCTIDDIQNPLSFDGSLLKRGKVILSSLKNTINLKIHIIDNENKEFVCPLSIPIVLENKGTGESIYNGYFTNEIVY